MFTFIKAIINKSSLFYKCIPLGDSRFLNHLRVNMVVHFKGVGRFAQKWTILFLYIMDAGKGGNTSHGICMQPC